MNKQNVFSFFINNFLIDKIFGKVYNKNCPFISFKKILKKKLLSTNQFEFTQNNYQTKLFFLIENL